MVRVYDLTGRLIWDSMSIYSSYTTLCEIYWDLRGRDGLYVANGTYFYRMWVWNSDSISCGPTKTMVVSR
jgi:hypothetical protein